MSISVDQFLQQLVQSVLMSDNDVSDYLRTRSPEKMPVDGDDLVGDLVQDKRLTKFQAVTIYRGNRLSLVFGDYIAISKLGRGGMGKFFSGGASQDRTAGRYQDAAIGRPGVQMGR